MSLSFGNYVNFLLIIGLSNNLTIVTQGGIPVKLHILSYYKIQYNTIQSSLFRHKQQSVSRPTRQYNTMAGREEHDNIHMYERCMKCNT